MERSQKFLGLNLLSRLSTGSRTARGSYQRSWNTWKGAEGAAVREILSLFSSVQGRTHLIKHAIDVRDAMPVQLPSYPVNPLKQKVVNELEYILKHGVVTMTYGHWSSPFALQPKPDGKIRFCMNFRRMNALNNADT